MTTLSNLTKVRKNYEGATLPAHHCHRINCSFVAGVMDAFCIPSSRPTATVHRPDFTQALIAKLKSFLGAASLLPKKQLGYIYIYVHIYGYTLRPREKYGGSCSAKPRKATQQTVLVWVFVFFCVAFVVSFDSHVTCVQNFMYHLLSCKM